MNTINPRNYDCDTNTTPAAIAAATIPSQLESVKRQIFAQFQSALGANDQLLRLAIIEADALARQTDFPHLLFPLLAAEKAWNAARWQFHQQFLLRSNEALAA
jgi:hypothetical protein